MKNEFVTYEQALALKELGFDEPCFSFYIDVDKFLYTNQKWLDYNLNSRRISAPLYSQAFRWFREKHGLHANINSVADSTQYGFIPNGKYSGTIDDVTIGKEMIATDTVCLIPVGDTYEEAEQACLDKLIEIIKNK
jgi:hypothetical protein